jgi:hypothetical protein
MKMTAKFIDRYPISAAEYWELEGSVKEQKQESLINQFLQALVAKLSSSNEPQIKLRYNSKGQEFWRVYDPTTGKTATLMDESDVRVWLEQRYYQ